jgi:hypothetical protein
MSHTKPIDLGKKWNDDIGIPISPGDLKDKVHYPDLYLSDMDDPRLLDMPDEGTAEIHYRIIRRNHSEEKRGDKKQHRCSITMEVQKIEPGHDPKFNGKKKDSDNGARKALSEYFKDK